MLSVLEGWDGASIRFVEVIRNAAARVGVAAPWSLGELPWSDADEEFFFRQVSARDTRYRVLNQKPSGSLMLLVALFLKARRHADRGDFWRSIFEAFEGTEWLLFRNAGTMSIDREYGEALVRTARNNGLRHEAELGGNRFVHTVQYQYGIAAGELADPKTLAWLRNTEVGSYALKAMLSEERLASFREAVSALQYLATGRASRARFLLEAESNPWLWFAADLVLAERSRRRELDVFADERVALAPSLRWRGERPTLEFEAGNLGTGADLPGGTLYLGRDGVALQRQPNGALFIPRNLSVDFELNVFAGVLGADGWLPAPQWHAESLLTDGCAVLRVGRPLDPSSTVAFSAGVEIVVVLGHGLRSTGSYASRATSLAGGFRAELHRLSADTELRIVDADGLEVQTIEPRRAHAAVASDITIVARSSVDKVRLGDWSTVGIEWSSTSGARPTAVSLGERFVPLTDVQTDGRTSTASARVRMPLDGQPNPRVFVRGRGPLGTWIDGRAVLDQVDVFGSVIRDERGQRRIRPEDTVNFADPGSDVRVVLPAGLRRHWRASANALPVFLGNRLVGEVANERLTIHQPARLFSFGETLMVDRDVIGAQAHVIAWQPVRTGEIVAVEVSDDARTTRVSLRRPLRLSRLRCTFRAADGSFLEAPLPADDDLTDSFTIDNSGKGVPSELLLCDAERAYGTWSLSNNVIPGEVQGLDICWSLATGFPVRGRRFPAQQRMKLPIDRIPEAAVLALSSGPFPWPVTLDARIAWLQAISPSIVGQLDAVSAALEERMDAPDVQALLGMACPILRTTRGATTADAYADVRKLVELEHPPVPIDEPLEEYLETSLMHPRVLSNPQLFVHAAFSQLAIAERRRGM